MAVADYLPMIILVDNDCRFDLKFEDFKKRWKEINAALTCEIGARQA